MRHVHVATSQGSSAKSFQSSFLTALCMFSLSLVFNLFCALVRKQREEQGIISAAIPLPGEAQPGLKGWRANGGWRTQDHPQKRIVIYGFMYDYLIAMMGTYISRIHPQGLLGQATRRYSSKTSFSMGNVRHVLSPKDKIKVNIKFCPWFNCFAWWCFNSVVIRTLCMF